MSDRVRVIGPDGKTGTVPAGTTLPEGWAVVDSVSAPPASPPMPETAHGRPMLRTLALRAAGLLPEIGATAGSMVGGAAGLAAAPFLVPVPPAAAAAPFVGRTAGSYLGGAGAELLRQALTPDPTSLADANRVGAEQALYGVIGEGIAKPIGAAGRLLKDRALSPTAKMLREFPGTNQAIRKYRIPVGAPPRSGGAFEREGSKKAAALRSAAAGRTAAARKQAETLGVGSTARDLAVPAARRTLKSMRYEPDYAASAEAVQDAVRTIQREHPGVLSPEQIKKLASGYTAAGKRVLKAVEGGELPGPAISGPARFHADVGSEARNFLRENVPPLRGRSYRQLESEVQDLIGAERATRRAEALPPLRYTPFGLLPLNVPRAPVHGLGLALDDPLTEFLLRYGPRAVAGLADTTGTGQ